MRLRKRARLKFDRVRSTWILMYPEGGLVLNRTAREIVELCQCTVTHTELLATLSSRYPNAPPRALIEDTNELLAQLETRGLLERGGTAKRCRP